MTTDEYADEFPDWHIEIDGFEVPSDSESGERCGVRFVLIHEGLPKQAFVRPTSDVPGGLESITVMENSDSDRYSTGAVYLFDNHEALFEGFDVTTLDDYEDPFPEHELEFAPRLTAQNLSD